MTRAAIISAFPGELKHLVLHWQHERHGSVDLWHWTHDAGTDEQGQWIAACAGAGGEQATRAFAAAEQFARSAQPVQSSQNLQLVPIGQSALSSPIDLAVSTGWAGALHRVLEPGLVYSVAGVIDARTGEMIPTAELRQDIWLVTSPIVALGPEKDRLAATYNAGLVDMEASTIARLATMRNIPFYCVKGVSDGLYDNLPDLNRFLTPAGQLDLARLTLFALVRPWYWPSLIRMGENSRKAAGGIAEHVLEVLDPRGVIRNRNGYPDRKR